MARINLLPWRADRRKQREREFYYMLAAAAFVAIVIVSGFYIWMDARIVNQQDRVQFLQNQIKDIDNKIQEIKDLETVRSQLLARKQIIEHLQSNRSQMVHLFDEMVKSIPDGVRLTSLKQAGDNLTLEGLAESSGRVANYMQNIDGSPWMGRAELRKLENKSGDKSVDKKMPYLFSLEVKLHKPEDVEQAIKMDSGKETSSIASPLTAVKSASLQPAVVSGTSTSTDKTAKPLAPQEEGAKP